MKYAYRLYQLFIAAPILLVWTIFISLTVAIGCTIGNGHFWGYYPGKWWGWLILKVLLIPVKVEGREHLDKGQSYVFVSNHQGAFDIFLIYGHLNRNFKWMMKWQLKKIPFVGYACKKSHQIFVDKRGASKIKKSYDEAREILRNDISLTVFPEGAPPSPVTWGCSAGVLLCWLMSYNCPWYLSPSTVHLISFPG